MNRRNKKNPAQQAARLMTVEMIAELLVSADPRDLSRKLTEQLRELTGARTVLLITPQNESGSCGVLHACPTRRAAVFPPEELVLFWQGPSSSPLPRRTEDLATDHPWHAPLRRAEVESLFHVPLRVGSELIGLLLVLDLPAPDRVAEAGEIITLVSAPIALALRNALAYDQIEQQKQRIQHYADELERRVQERTAALAAANEELIASRLAALNIMEDALAARTRADEANAALRERNRYIDTVLENAPIGFAVNTIHDGKAVFVSSRFEEIYGVPRDSLHSVDEYFEKVYRDPGFGEQIRARILADMATGDAARMRWEDIPLTTATGEKRFVTAINIPLLDQNLMVSTVQDVTARHLAEEARQESEAGLAAAQRLAHIGSWRWNIATDMASWSEETFRIFGVARGPLQQHRADFLSRTVPEDRPRVDQALSDALSGARDYDLDYRIRLPDGREKVIHAQAQVLRSSDGRPVIMHGMVQDITERRRAEEALRLANQWMRLHVEQTPLAVIEFDLTGCIRGWNPAATAIFGFSREEAIGQFWHFIVPEPVWTQLDGVWEGLVSRRGGSRSTNDNRTKDGQIIHCEWFNTPLVDTDGQTIGVASLVQDVTERRRAEAALREREEIYSAIVNQAADGIVLVDAHSGRLVEFNEAAHESLGYRREEFAQLTVADIDVGIGPERLPDHMAATFARGRVEFETRQRHRSGELRDTRVSVRSLNLRGGDYFAAIWSDITERKRAEETLRESEERFAQFMNHLPGVAFIKDAETRHLYVNRQFEELFHLGHDDWFGKTNAQLFPAAVAAALTTSDQDVLSGEAPIQIEEDVQGSHWLTAKFPLRLRGGTSVLGGIAVDITNRKQVEAALRESEARYRALFEQAGDFTLVLEMGPQGVPVIVDVNEAALQVHGYTRAELIGQPISVVDADVSRGVASQRMRALQAEGQMLLNVRHRRRDGSVFDVEARVKLVRIGAKEVFLSVERDVTARNLAEERLRTYQHQLRGLASQLSLAEERERRRIAVALHDHTCQNLVLTRMKLDELLKSASAAQAGVFRGISNLLGDTIQDVRELTFDLSSPTLYKFGLEAALEELLADKLGAADGTAYDFRDDHEPKPLSEDVQVLLFQSVREVLTNVVKHARAHRIGLDIRRTEDSIRITVTDDGVGFDVKEVSSLPARHRGFGLFSIKERLGCVGGVLEIDSRRGAGSRFTLVAPLKREGDDSGRKHDVGQNSARG